MRLDELTLVRRRLMIDGLPVAIDASADQDALLRDTAARDLLPFGLMLWESALLLADTVSGLRLAGCVTLELGAGAGLVGVVAAQRGAIVHARDIDPLAVALCASNAAVNGVADRLTAGIGDWRDWPSTDLYDLVLGADILYDRGDHRSIVHLLSQVTTPGARILLTDPCRPHTASFVRLLRDDDWLVTTHTQRVADLTRPDVTIDIQLIEAGRHV